MKAFVSLAMAWIVLLPAGSAGQVKKKGPQAKKAASQPADRRLSLDRIQKLIAIQTPDSAVAQEIQARGINGDYGRPDLDRLRRQGAGPETMAALTRLMPVATLTVRTEPGATVSLDNGSSVVAGPDGTAILPNIDPGPHRIAAEKQYFAGASRALELKGRETASVEIKLEWTVGFLNVATNVPTAQIRVAGAPPLPGPITRLPVPVGQATITAMAPLRTTVTQAIRIDPGKESTMSLTLPVDSAALTAAASQIHQAFKSRQFLSVLRQAAQYRQAAVPGKDVLAEVALSHLHLGRLTDFPAAGHEALAAGAALRFPLQHRHRGFNAGLHPAALVVTAQTVGFDTGGKCNIPPFEISWKEVRNLENPDPLSLKISIPNPSNPKKQSTLELWQDFDDPVQIKAISRFLSALMRNR